MISLIYGIVIGILTTGTQTWRTIHVGKGNVFQSVSSSIVLSFSYYFSVVFVVNQDFIGYIGYSIGSALVVLVMAYINKENDKKEAIDTINENSLTVMLLRL